MRRRLDPIRSRVRPIVLFLIVAVVSSFALTAQAHGTDADLEANEVTLTPTTTADGSVVTLDIAGMTLDVTFTITPEGAISITKVSGQPVDAKVYFAGDDLVVKPADGPAAKADLHPVYDTSGTLTAVKARTGTRLCDHDGDRTRFRSTRFRDWDGDRRWDGDRNWSDGDRDGDGWHR